MQLGLTQAAKLTGKDPSTITRSARSGKLSYHTAPDGTRTFDVAELERVFGPLEKQDESRTGALDVQSTSMHEQIEELADRERELLKDQIHRLERQVDDLKADREKWQQQASAITRLLTDERAEARRTKEEAERARVVVPPPPALKGFKAMLAVWKRGRA